jgi:hypothetical protein
MVIPSIDTISVCHDCQKKSCKTLIFITFLKPKTMAEETKGSTNTLVYSNRKKPDETVPLFLNAGSRLEVEEESCCSAHSTLVSDQNTTFTAVKLHGKVMTLKGTRLETWPSSTDVACWYDTFPFSTVPIPLPHHYDQQKKAFVIYGNVCSVECGLAYMHRESRRHDLWERVVLFEDMMRKVFGQKMMGCEPAPPFLTLSRFGGFYSIEEYRASFNTVKMTVIAPPFLMYPLVIQEKHHNSTGTKEVVQDETVLSTGHVLRGLRRPQKSSASGVPGVLLGGGGTPTVPALDQESSSDAEEAPVQHTGHSTVVVPPLSSVQVDNVSKASNTTTLTAAANGKNKSKGRGRGRGLTRSPAGSGTAASTPVSSNTMLSSFLIKK